MTKPPTTDDYSWGESVPHLLWRAQNAVHKQAQDAIDELGVTVTQLGLAVHLGELGALSASDLARGFRITPQSVTTALTRLEEIGWIERRPHPVHGRVILNALTEQGRDGVREGSTRMAAVNRRLEETLAAEGTVALKQQLGRLLAELEPGERPVEALWPART